MTPYRAPRLLLTVAMVIACFGSVALWLAYAAHPLSPIGMIVIVWAPLGVAWAWFSAEGMARRRNRRIAKGETVTEDHLQYGRLLLHSFFALLAFGDIILLAQAYGVLGHDLNVMAYHALTIAMGLVVMIWGDRRAKVISDPDAGSVPRQRRAAWFMVLLGAALIPSTFLLPPLYVMIGFCAAIIVLTALDIMSRPRAT